jgi:hypothetical protein
MPDKTLQVAMDAQGSPDFSQWDSHSIDFSALLPPYASDSHLHINQPGHTKGLSEHNGIAILHQDQPPLTTATPTSANGDVSGVNSRGGTSKINKEKKSRSFKEKPGDKAASKPGPISCGCTRKHTTVFCSKLDTDGTTEQEKRVKFLERNRLAASKCRARRKLQSSKLEERARVLASQRDAISKHITMLKHELIELKIKCLDHSDCDCKQIRQYLKSTITSPLTESLSDQISNSHVPELSSGLGSVSSPVSDPTFGSPSLDEAQDSLLHSFAEIETDFMQVEYDEFAAWVNGLQQGKNGSSPIRFPSSVDSSAMGMENIDT